MNRFLTLVSGLLLASTGGAQDVPADDSEEMQEMRRYTVEVIVFEYLESITAGTEVFVPELLNPPMPEQQEPVEDAEATDEPVEALIDEPVVPFEYVTLRRDELTLTETMERLQRLDAYRPLMHFGWTQTTVPDAETPALQIERFGQPPPGLDGTLTLYLSRFLHLVVDLSLLAPQQEDDLAQRVPRYDGPVVYGDARGSDRFDDWYRPEFAPLRYRINEDRIMKNGETRYYDHPKFGVIAKVTRVEEEPPASVRP